MPDELIGVPPELLRSAVACLRTAPGTAAALAHRRLAALLDAYESPDLFAAPEQRPVVTVPAPVLGTSARPPIARPDDDWSARLAAQRVEPTRGTRKDAVLSLLRAAQGSWVDGPTIASPSVGGSEGLRRLRELREADGWPIERRPHSERSTSWQYRLRA